MAHIGKLMVPSGQLIAAIYEFEEGQVSLTNIDPAGYRLLEALANEERLGILELRDGRRVAFQIVRAVAVLIHKMLVCTAKIWPDPYVGFILQEWQAQAGTGQYDEGVT
jgi:hypothetical protein